MANKSFPRTEVAGVSLPRMLMGTNWVLGYSHTSGSADNMIKRVYGTKEAVCDMVEAYLQYDIDAIMAPMDSPVLLDAVLIPFRDSIISDGLVVPYRIRFSKGAVEDFKEVYMNAKRNHTIRFSILSE